MHPEIDRYAHLESPFHSWDPGFKLMGFSLYLFGLATLESPWAVFFGFLISLLFLLGSRISIGFVLGRLQPVVLFMIPFFLLLPLSLERTATGGLTLVWDLSLFGFALLLSIRALAIVLAVFPMFGTAPFHLSMKSLQDLGVPTMVVQSMLFTYRYLFVYLEQFRKMSISMQSRGFQPKFDLRTFRTYAYQVGMLLVISYEQTERILAAMKSRGYDGTLRLLYQPQRVPSDWVKLAGMTVLTASLCLGDRLWTR